MFSGTKSGSASLLLGLQRLEEVVVFDGVVDGGGGEQGVERRPPVAASCLSRMASTTACLASVSPGLGSVLAFGLEVIDVEAEDVPVLDGVGDGVGVELLLEEVLAWFEGWLTSPSICLTVALSSKIGRAGEAEELGLGEELLDGLVVLAELRAVALVEDEDHALVAQRLELFLVGRPPLCLFCCLLRLLFSSSARPSFWMVVTMTLSA